MEQRLKELTFRSNGECQKKRYTQLLYQSFGELLQNGRNEKFIERHKLLVPETSPNVFLEKVETHSDEVEDVDKSWQNAITRKSYWHTANSFTLNRTITTQRLKKAGYPFLLDYYLKVRT